MAKLPSGLSTGKPYQDEKGMWCIDIKIKWWYFCWIYATVFFPTAWQMIEAKVHGPH
jgi:hypothetical protein